MEHKKMTAIFTVLAICLSVITSKAQTARNAIGARAADASSGFTVDPRTGIPVGLVSETKPPTGVRLIKGRVRSIQNNLVLVSVERFVNDQFVDVTVAMTNHPGLKALTSNTEFYDYGKPVGVLHEINGDQLELYEYFDFQSYRVKQEEITNSEARDRAEMKKHQEHEKAEVGKLRALRVNQEAADKGDGYGLLRMGERYRDGEGVEKDINKARLYLQKAVDAGSPTAKEELLKLDMK